MKGWPRRAGAALHPHRKRRRRTETLSDPIAALSTPPGRSALASSGLGTGVAIAAGGGRFCIDLPREMRLAAFSPLTGRDRSRALHRVPAPHSYTR
jgi:hypothetical protein